MNKSLAHIDKVLVAVDSFHEATSETDHKWHWAKLREYARGLFDRAPFKDGDRVRLKKTPEINIKDSWGWMHAKHFLVEGCEGTVSDVDYRDGRFVALFCPDNQTFILDWGEMKGIPQPIDGRPGHYGFSEEYLERVSANDPTRGSQ